MFRILRFAAAAMLIAASAAAQTVSTSTTLVQYADGPFCDTQPQIERYVEIIQKSTREYAALEQVNTEFKVHNACIPARVAFHFVKFHKNIPGTRQDLQIVEVRVVAAYASVDNQWELMDPPVHWFTVFPEAGDKV